MFMFKNGEILRAAIPIGLAFSLIACAGNNSTSLNQPPTGSRLNSPNNGSSGSNPIILRPIEKFAGAKLATEQLAFAYNEQIPELSSFVTLSTDSKKTEIAVLNLSGKNLMSYSVEDHLSGLAVSKMSTDKEKSQLLATINITKNQIEFYQFSMVPNGKLVKIDSAPFLAESIAKPVSNQLSFDHSKDQTVQNLIINTKLTSNTSSFLIMSVNQDGKKVTSKLKAQLNSTLTEKSKTPVSFFPVIFNHPLRHEVFYNSINNKLNLIPLNQDKPVPVAFDEPILNSPTDAVWATLNNKEHLFILSSQATSSRLEIFVLNDSSPNRLEPVGNLNLPISGPSKIAICPNPLKSAFANGFLAAINPKDNSIQLFDLAAILKTSGMNP